MRETSGPHTLIGAELSEQQAIAKAESYGWRAEPASARLFKFVKVWVESRFLIELLPPEHGAEYCAALGPVGIEQLDQKLRAIEQALQGKADDRVEAQGPRQDIAVIVVATTTSATTATITATVKSVVSDDAPKYAEELGSARIGDT